jgi:hypothetical protein
MTQEIAREQNWLQRNRNALLIGAAAVATVAPVFTDPFEATKDRVLEAAPWVAGGLAAGEIGWLGGAAMMLYSVGSSIDSPKELLGIRKRLPEIAAHANTSWLFNSGFWINTSAAVAQTGVLVAGVTSELPAKSWGILGFAAADFALTISVRRAIKKGVKNNAQNEL